MKVRLSLFRILIILASPSLSLRAVSAPQANPTPRILVETAIERMGGHEIFDAVQRLSTEESGLQYHVMDAEHPSPPFYPDYFHAQEQIDFQIPAVRRKFTDGADALYGNHADAVYTPTDVTAVNQRAGKTVLRRTPTPRHWLLQNPIAVLRAALTADDLKPAPDVVIWGVNQHSVAFHHEGTPVRLFFNPLNGYLTASEIITTEPWEVVWDIADVRLKTLYDDWEIEPGGFHFPQQWDVFFDDLPFMTRTVSSVSVNPSFPSDTFQPLADEATPMRGNVDDLAPGPPDRPLVELAPGVLQVTPGPMPGNFTTIIVNQTDGIVIIEAPCSSGWSNKIIEEAQRRFPGVPIKAVVTADNIWWHFAGIREYVARGIPIYLLDQNAAILRSLIAAPRTLNPDTLQQHPRKPNLIQVSGPLTIGSGPNRVVLYPIRASTDQFLMTYLPGHRLLYTADMAQPFGPGGSFVSNQAIWEVREEVLRQKIKVDNIMGLHMLQTPWSKLDNQVNEALKTTKP